MLYLATAGDQPLRSSTELTVEEVENSMTSVHQWFSIQLSIDAIDPETFLFTEQFLYRVSRR